MSEEEAFEGAYQRGLSDGRDEVSETLAEANARIDRLAEERGKYRLRVRELETAARLVTEGWSDPHVPVGAVRHDFVDNMAALAALVMPSVSKPTREETIAWSKEGAEHVPEDGVLAVACPSDALHRQEPVPVEPPNEISVLCGDRHVTYVRARTNESRKGNDYEEKRVLGGRASEDEATRGGDSEVLGDKDREEQHAPHALEDDDVCDGRLGSGGGASGETEGESKQELVVDSSEAGTGGRFGCCGAEPAYIRGRPVPHSHPQRTNDALPVRADCTNAFAEMQAAGVVTINMQTPAPKMRGDHAHGCPVCHEKVPCDDACSIELDLFKEGETPLGAYVTCESCQAKAQRPDKAVPGLSSDVLTLQKRVYELEKAIGSATETIFRVALELLPKDADTDRKFVTDVMARIEKAMDRARTIWPNDPPWDGAE